MLHGHALDAFEDGVHALAKKLCFARDVRSRGILAQAGDGQIVPIEATIDVKNEDLALLLGEGVADRGDGAGQLGATVGGGPQARRVAGAGGP
jgi:hypothetical protein